MKDFLEKNWVKLYFVAGSLLAYRYSWPIFFNEWEEWLADEGLINTILLGLGFFVALPVVISYGLMVVSLMLIPLLVFMSIANDNRDIESIMALIWVAIGTLCVLFGVFFNGV